MSNKPNFKKQEEKEPQTATTKAKEGQKPKEQPKINVPEGMLMIAHADNLFIVEPMSVMKRAKFEDDAINSLEQDLKKEGRVRAGWREQQAYLKLAIFTACFRGMAEELLNGDSFKERSKASIAAWAEQNGALAKSLVDAMDTITVQNEVKAVKNL